ncbi:phosphonate ABC transporter, permease protein PhnE [Lapidilactobacillus wuchangensis]|uniref:phosphonate ABC transporter, permease protein PhnE n=1 Tax=Lapidilactobacillus wuchangensis TaxID=2486001 RepID=UPI000F79EB08|nr:phosphonate ABC transporter, permease protein PhnE [Lapidilactobacillus wuchangensis]
MDNLLEAKLTAQPSKKRQYLLLVAVILAVFAWSLTAIKFRAPDDGGAKIAANIIRGILSPDLNLLWNFTSQGVFYLLFETICIAFLGTIFGAILSIPFAFLMAPSVVSRPVYILTRFLVVVIRTVPALVYGLMFVRVAGPGPFAGVLTMSLTSIGMVSKLYVDVIEDLDRGILEAMDAIGCTTWEKIRFGIVPQLIANFSSITIYRFDMNLRDATILGLVGAGGIGAPLIFAMNAYRWHQVGSILIGLVALILIVEIISNKLRAKLVNG